MHRTEAELFADAILITGLLMTSSYLASLDPALSIAWVVVTGLMTWWHG